MPPKLPSAFASGIVRTPSQLTRHRTYPWTCSTCQTVSVLRSPHPPNPRRAFTTTPPLPKKSSNSNSSSSKQAPKRTTAAATPNTAKSDPLDFSVFEADIKRTLDGLKHDLGRIRAGGLDAEKIENVRVKLGPGGRGEVVRVGEVAQVVQRGRVMVIMVGEGEHLKPVTTALTAALSITPSTPPSSAPLLELHLPIPPTTAESRAEAQKEAAGRGEAALAALREARGAQKKKLRAMGLAKVVGPDEMFKAEKELERVNEAGVGECRRVVEERRRAVGR